MIYPVTRLFLGGEEFDPEQAEVSLRISFSHKVVRGTPLRRGGVSQLGSAVLSSSELGLRASIRCTLLEFISYANKLKGQLKALGADEIQLHQDCYHDGQCNMQYSTEEIAAIHSLGVGFTLSCYQDTDFIREVELLQMNPRAKP